MCKPLAAHGKTDAHEMMILFKEDDLKLISCPAIVQNFENHDGFLIKAYVIGGFTHLVTRPSIKNLSKGLQPL